MDTLFKDKIKQYLQEGGASTAIAELNAYLESHGEDDEAWLLLGNAYRKNEDWQGALNSYAKAMEINEASPAGDAYNHIIQILNFYDTDRYNV